MSVNVFCSRVLAPSAMLIGLDASSCQAARWEGREKPAASSTSAAEPVHTSAKLVQRENRNPFPSLANRRLAGPFSGPSRLRLERGRDGHLYGRAFDALGAPWSGIEVTSTAPAQTARVQVTDAKGFYRFLGLPPGDYELQVKLPDGSLQTVERVVISAGRNTVMKDFLVFEDAQEYLRCLESDCCGGDTEGCGAGACIPVLVAQPAGRR
ncbi:MAG TPA: carboxypeptidase-like regulatory domain-containing protein [Thermoanaerobaculia bacterium]